MIDQRRTIRFFAYVLIASIALSLTGNCPGGAGLCIVAHDECDVPDADHHTHGTLPHLHSPSGHDSHHLGSTEECCPCPFEIPTGCVRISPSLDKPDSAKSALTGGLSALIAAGSSEFSQLSLISQAPNAPDPMLAFLRTVILLA